MKNISIYIFSILILICTVNSQFLNNEKNTAKIVLNSVTNCEPNSPWIWNQDAKTINDTHLSITANATINKPLDDSLSIRAELKQLHGSTWKNVIVLSKKRACSTLKLYGGTLFNEISQKMGLPSGKCPIPTGSYSVQEELIDLSKTPLTKFLAGRFQGKVAAFDANKVVLLCVLADFSAVKI